MFRSISSIGNDISAWSWPCRSKALIFHPQCILSTARIARDRNQLGMCCHEHRCDSLHMQPTTHYLHSLFIRHIHPCANHTLSAYHFKFSSEALMWEKIDRFKTSFCIHTMKRKFHGWSWVTDQTKLLQWPPLMSSPSWTTSAEVVFTPGLPKMMCAYKIRYRNLMLSDQQDLLASCFFFVAFESRIPVNWCIKSYASCGRSF